MDSAFINPTMYMMSGGSNCKSYPDDVETSFKFPLLQEAPPIWGGSIHLSCRTSPHEREVHACGACRAPAECCCTAARSVGGGGLGANFWVVLWFPPKANEGVEVLNISLGGWTCGHELYG